MHVTAAKTRRHSHDFTGGLFGPVAAVLTGTSPTIFNTGWELRRTTLPVTASTRFPQFPASRVGVVSLDRQTEPQGQKDKARTAHTRHRANSERRARQAIRKVVWRWYEAAGKPSVSKMVLAIKMVSRIHLYSGLAFKFSEVVGKIC